MDLREISYSQRRALPTSSRHTATTDAVRAAKKAWVEVVWGAATKVQNCVRGIPEMVSGFRGVSSSAARPMRLTARQCFQIATVYEYAAADAMNVPRQQRAAFTRKARWFHMLARIKAAKEAAVVFKKNPLASDDSGLNSQVAPGVVWAPNPKYRTLVDPAIMGATTLPSRGLGCSAGSLRGRGLRGVQFPPLPFGEERATPLRTHVSIGERFAGSCNRTIKAAHEADLGAVIHSRPKGVVDEHA
jgi:hypothetical protein